MRANKTMRGQAVSNHRRRKDKESESNINSAAHNQTLKELKLNGRNYQISINISTECQRMSMDSTSPSKDTVWKTVLKRKIQQSAVYRRPSC
jgi:hypothetical protein